MVYRRIGGAAISIAAAAAMILLPERVQDFSLIGKELIWEALAMLLAAGLALIFWPLRRKKAGSLPG